MLKARETWDLLQPGSLSPNPRAGKRIVVAGPEQAGFGVGDMIDHDKH